MLQIIFPFLAGAMEAYATAVSFASIWSSSWYQGEGGSYGIATGCQDGNATAAVGEEGAFTVKDFCEFSWSDLEGTTQQITAGFLFAAGILGVIAFLLLLIMVFGRFCFAIKPFAGAMVKWICLLQFCGLAGALIAISGYWRWGTPPGTSVGAMFYLVATAAVGALISAIILDWTYKFNRRRERQAKKKANEPSPLERSKPPGYGQNNNRSQTSTKDANLNHSQVNIEDSKVDLMADNDENDDVEADTKSVHSTKSSHSTKSAAKEDSAEASAPAPPAGDIPPPPPPPST